MFKKSVLILITVIALVGCQAMPQDAMRLGPKSLEKRQLQSKKFDTLHETTMLSASMEVLQDMGFMINESESKLGVIVGNKTRETDNKMQRAALITLNILAGTGTLKGIEKSHNIKVSLVTAPDKNNKNTTVRINFQREVFDMENNLVKIETINEKELYQGFFSKLAKSVFLEAHEI